MLHEQQYRDLAATDIAKPYFEAFQRKKTGQNQSARSVAPVFVLGSPRSGTTLLYHMLLSAGGFAVYRTESNVYNFLRPCFGNFASAANRRRLMDAWLESKLFARSGLDRNDIQAKIMNECRTAGDFLRITMNEIARRQNVSRWADCTPEHLLYLAEIKKAFPDALIIHIIRDGRDVALSLEKQHWIRPLVTGGSALLAAGFYWEWIVGEGRRQGRDIPDNYLEVRFEELIQSPRQTLDGISSFIKQELDYDQILQTAIGSVKQPNTSFGAEIDGAKFSPVFRWKSAFPPAELEKFESAVGPTLRNLGYALTQRKYHQSISLRALRKSYRIAFASKLWMKKSTPLGPLLMTPDLSWL